MLFSFQAPGFETEEEKPLSEQPVDIVTFYAPGLRPRRYAPASTLGSTDTPVESKGAFLKAIVMAGGGGATGPEKGVI